MLGKKYIFEYIFSRSQLNFHCKVIFFINFTLACWSENILDTRNRSLNIGNMHDKSNHEPRWRPPRDLPPPPPPGFLYEKPAWEPLEATVATEIYVRYKGTVSRDVHLLLSSSSYMYFVCGRLWFYYFNFA